MRLELTDHERTVLLRDVSGPLALVAERYQQRGVEWDRHDPRNGEWFLLLARTQDELAAPPWAINGSHLELERMLTQFRHSSNWSLRDGAKPDPLTGTTVNEWDPEWTDERLDATTVYNVLLDRLPPL